MDIKIYTKDEAQKILRVGTNKIGCLLQTGKLKGMKEGRKWLIPSSSIDNFIKEGVQNGYKVTKSN
ncbi:MAG: helix-turn-helix domain-containing protein [Proteobacteria bacterium]|nr:helix-turn-helix domain-containing protein [Pseudomonadota bacterium]